MQKDKKSAKLTDAEKASFKAALKCLNETRKQKSFEKSAKDLLAANQSNIAKSVAFFRSSY